MTCAVFSAAKSKLDGRTIGMGMTKAGWRRLLLYPALLSLGAGMLASCAEAPPPPPPQKVAAVPVPPPPAPRPRRAAPHPAHKPAPPAEPENPAAEGGDDTALVGTEATAHAPAPPPVPGSQQLIGLDQAAAKRLFGAAAEQSDQPPATVWRYRSATCGLDLYFYLDLRSGRMRTLHYAFNGDAADPAGRQSCLKSLVVTRRT